MRTPRIERATPVKKLPNGNGNGGVETVPGDPVPSVTFNIIRPDDLLILNFEFFHFELQNAGTPDAKIVRTPQTADPYILRVRWQPLAFEEYAYDVALNLSQVRRRLLVAARSRVDFKIPDAVTEIPLADGVASFLTFMRQWPMAVPSCALHDNPTADELALARYGDPYVGYRISKKFKVQIIQPIINPGTRLQVLYGLFLSPNDSCAWIHDTGTSAPVKPGSVLNEIWHSRMGVRDGSGNVTETPGTENLSVRSVWYLSFGNDPDTTPDSGGQRTTVVPLPDAGAPLPADLADNIRAQISALTANPKLPFLPIPLPAEHLVLSSLGAWFKTHAGFPDTPGFSLANFSYTGAQGRDQFVRVATRGRLFPTGHRAVQDALFFRNFEHDSNFENWSLLRKTTSIYILEQERRYSSDVRYARSFPFAGGVRILQTKLADIPPSTLIPGTRSFWIPNALDLEANDADGNIVPLQTQLIFLADGDNVDLVRTAYMQEPPTGRRMFTTTNTAVGFATSNGNTSARLTTQSLTLKLADVVPPGDEAPFAPLLEAASVVVPALQQITGNTNAVLIKLNDAYQQASSIYDQTQVFADIARFDPASGDVVPDLLPLAVSMENSGGMAAPSSAIAGLSQSVGTVLGYQDQATGAIKTAADVLQGNGPSFQDLASGVLDKINLLGAFPVKDIIDVPDATAFSSITSQLPAINTIANPVAKTVTASFTWKPKVKADSDGKIASIGNSVMLTVRKSGNPSIQPTLEIDVQSTKHLDTTTSPNFHSNGNLQNVSLELFNLLQLNFTSVAFSSTNGGRITINLTLDQTQPFQFLGDLDILTNVAEAVKAMTGSLGNGAFVDIDQDRVVAGYGIALPSVAIGVFTLANIAFRIAVTFPLNGDPVSFLFAAADRTHPFRLTCTVFAGGGYFAIESTFKDLIRIEGALEFGASVELDLVVASGGVSIMAGVYLLFTAAAGLNVSGYLRATGHVEVLDIVSISVEFNLTLTYESTPKKISGSAEISVSVTVGFFSKTVSLTMTREFGTSGGDPTFAETITLPQWQLYGEAFA
jgi:hypothetical protein